MNPEVKLTLDQAREIRDRYYAGRASGQRVRQVDLAVEYGVSQTSISFIVNGHRWKDA